MDRRQPPTGAAKPQHQPFQLPVLGGCAAVGVVAWATSSHVDTTPLVSWWLWAPIWYVCIALVILVAWASSSLALPLLLAKHADTHRSKRRTRFNRSLPRVLRGFQTVPQPASKLAVTKRLLAALGDATLVAKAEGILALVIRDFVETWHAPLVSGVPSSQDQPSTVKSDARFPAAVYVILVEALCTIADRTRSLDTPTMLVQKMLPALTLHMQRFEQAELKLHSSRKVRDGDDDIFLAAQYNGGRLHWAVDNVSAPDTRVSELAYLRLVAERIMKAAIPAKDAASPVVSLVIREILACTTLKSAVDALSDPDTLNRLIEDRTASAIREQNLVSRLRSALDKGDAKTLPISDVKIPSFGQGNFLHKEEDGSSKLFERTMLDIANLTSLLDARQLRSALESHIHKAEKAQDSSAAGYHLDKAASSAEKQRREIYIARLKAASDSVQQRIAQLDPTYPSSRQVNSFPRSVSPDRAFEENIKFIDLLMSPSAISIFVEFMESQQRAPLVQFWLAVETFKDPLETADDGESKFENQRASVEAAMLLRNDLAFFQRAYLLLPMLAKVVRGRDLRTIQDFLRHEASEVIMVHSLKKARKAVLAAQQEVFDEMQEDDWVAFRKHTTWRRAKDALFSEHKSRASVSTSTHHHLQGSEDADEEYQGKRRRADVLSLLVHPKGRGTAQVDLFGKHSGFLKDGGGPLFDDEGDDEDARGQRQLSHFDLLLGGKGGTFDPASGKAPLFREALFDDANEGASGDEDCDFKSNSGFVCIDKIDAVEQALAMIIREDLPLTHPREKRAKKLDEGFSRTSNFERPLLPRASNSRTSIDTSKVHAPHAAEGRADLRRNASSISLHPSTANGISPKVAHQENVPDTQFEAHAELQRLDEEIKRLHHHENILGALFRRSELTGTSAKEVSLIEKTQNTVQRELREANLKRSTLASEHFALVMLIPGRTSVNIGSCSFRQDDEGRDYTLYLINVLLPDGATGGTEPLNEGKGGLDVSRRYNEFHLLHNRLKESYKSVRALETLFPGKRPVGLMNKHIIESRRLALEKYLQALVGIDELCVSNELRAFLSQTILVFTTETLDRHFPTTSVKSLKGWQTAHGSRKVGFFGKGFASVAQGFDGILFPLSTFEVLASRLVSSGNNQLGKHDIERVLMSSTPTMPSAAEIEEAASVAAPSRRTASFAECICDAFVELFQLNLENNWLRRQAIVIVLQQALGGTIERKVRLEVGSLFTRGALLNHLTSLQEQFWPKGAPFSQRAQASAAAAAARTAADRQRTRENALHNLSTLFPNMAAAFIGRDRALRGGQRAWALLQCRRLNKHIIYTLLDEVLDEMFPTPSTSTAVSR